MTVHILLYFIALHSISHGASSKCVACVSPDSDQSSVSSFLATSRCKQFLSYPVCITNVNVQERDIQDTIAFFNTTTLFYSQDSDKFRQALLQFACYTSYPYCTETSVPAPPCREYCHKFYEIGGFSKDISRTLCHKLYENSPVYDKSSGQCTPPPQSLLKPKVTEQPPTLTVAGDETNSTNTTISPNDPKSGATTILSNFMSILCILSLLI